MAELTARNFSGPLLTIQQDSGSANPATITFTGELDRSNEPEARAAIDRLLRRGVKCLVVDLQNLSFMDSSGVNLLAHAYHQLMECHGTLALVVCHGPVHRILDVVHLSPLVPIYPTLQQALADLAPGVPPPANAAPPTAT